MSSAATQNDSKTLSTSTLCRHRLLGELLIDGGFVTPHEVACALKAQKKTGEKLGTILVTSERLSETTLKAALHLQSLLDKEHQPGSAFHRLLHESPNPQLGINAKHRIRLGELLIAEGEITNEQLEVALTKQQQNGKALGVLLIEAGWLDSKKLSFYLDLQHGLAAVLSVAVTVIGLQLNALAQQHKTTSPARITHVATASQVDFTQPAAYTAKPAKDLRWASIQAETNPPCPNNSGIRIRREALKERLAERRQIAAQTFRDRRLRVLTTGQSHTTVLHQAVAQNASKFSLPQELIYAIIAAESGYNPNAISPANAYGLMQVVPNTAGLEVNQMVSGRNYEPTPNDLLDPQNNIYFGSAYLRILQDHYFQDVQDPEVKTGLTIAAYNMGPSRLVSLIEENGYPENITALKHLLQEHAPQETQNYVNQVLNQQQRLLLTIVKSDTQRAA